MSYSNADFELALGRYYDAADRASTEAIERHFAGASLAEVVPPLRAHCAAMHEALKPIINRVKEG
jgi:hypothetical protein